MSVIYKGAQGIWYDEFTYRQDEGLLISRRERGIPSYIYPKAKLYRNGGWDVTTAADGPYVNLVATRNQRSMSYPYIERWTITTEILEKSLFALPKVVDEMESNAFVSGGRAGYVKAIEDAVKAKEPNYGVGTVADEVIRERRRGVESFQTEYTIVNRVITFDFQHPASEFDSNLQMRLDPIKYIYTKAQLNAPADVFFVLPIDPADSIPNTKWGYRIREQSAEMTNSTTGTHRTSWVYAQWSTTLYTPKP